MISCTLGEKKYTVDFVSGRALRELGPALEMYEKMKAISEAAVKGEEAKEEIKLADTLDVMVKWFCILFGNQFNEEEVYDGYPADKLMSDIVLAILAVNSLQTEVLDEFPTKAAQGKKKA